MINNSPEVTARSSENLLEIIKTQRFKSNHFRKNSIIQSAGYDTSNIESKN